MYNCNTYGKFYILLPFTKYLGNYLYVFIKHTYICLTDRFLASLGWGSVPSVVNRYPELSALIPRFH